MAEISPNLVKDIKLQVQTHLNPKQKNTKRSIVRHIIFKLLQTKEKEKNPKSSQRKIIVYRGTMI